MSFTNGGLYVVLLYRGDRVSWHWSYFIPDPAYTPLGATGTYFHCTDDTEEDTTCPCASQDAAVERKWRYERTTAATGHAERTVLVVRIADLAAFGPYATVADELDKVLRTVPVRRDAPRSVFSCRTWLLAGLRALHEAGFVDCENTAALEREITIGALLATDGFLQKRGWNMIVARSCS